MRTDTRHPRRPITRLDRQADRRCFGCRRKLASGEIYMRLHGMVFCKPCSTFRLRDIR